MKEITSPGEFTRHRLIMAALKLYSEKSIASVRVHEIVSEAGAKNNGALYYHFGNKDNLVQELYSTIQQLFDEIREPMIKEAKQLVKQKQLTVDHVSEILIFPYIHLIESEAWGYWAVRFFARSLTDLEPPIKDAIELYARDSARSMSRLLPHCLPDVPRKLLLSRFNFLAVAVIHGLSEHRSLKNSYFGNLSYPKLRQLADIYKNCMVAALSAPQDT